jgi:hypothetical protein
MNLLVQIIVWPVLIGTSKQPSILVYWLYVVLTNVDRTDAFHTTSQDSSFVLEWPIKARNTTLDI